MGRSALRVDPHLLVPYSMEFLVKPLRMILSAISERVPWNTLLVHEKPFSRGGGVQQSEVYETVIGQGITLLFFCCRQ